MCGFRPVIPALGMLRLEVHEFEASPGYILSLFKCMLLILPSHSVDKKFISY
jgi:hypothetical protein